jgi:undecaprenyl-diphosphatase
MLWLQALDLGVRDWMRSWWGSWWDPYIVELTALGGQTALTLVGMFALGLLLVLRRYQTTCFVGIAVLGGVLLVVGLKELVGRARPDEPLPLVRTPSSPSFPSGHTMNSSVIYLTLALVASASIPRRRVRAYIIGWSLVLVFLIGLSRVYLNVHWLTDVLAGWAGGLAWALACRWVEDHWLPLRRELRAARAASEDGSAE